MSDKPTCGPLYFDGLKEFTDLDPAKVPIFAAGFVSGQAEKVYLGACQAAMFRPSEEWGKVVFDIVVKVADRYGLHIATLPTSPGLEIWLCISPAVAQLVQKRFNSEENSPEWHEHRGTMCGVRPYHIDHKFHERSGYGQRCDGK